MDSFFIPKNKPHPKNGNIKNYLRELNKVSLIFLEDSLELLWSFLEASLEIPSTKGAIFLVFSKHCPRNVQGMSKECLRILLGTLFKLFSFIDILSYHRINWRGKMGEKRGR